MIAAVACWRPAEVAASVAYSASCYDVIEDIRILSVVKPERKFVQIQRQVLRANFVIVADDSPLEQRPERFNRLRVHATTHVFGLGVRDRIVRMRLAQIPVVRGFIGRDQRDVFRDDAANEVRMGVESGFLDHLADHVTLARDCADNLDFALRGDVAAFALVFVSLQTADPSLIGFYNVPHHSDELAIRRRSADARAHIPRGFVRAGSDHSVDLMRAHSLLGVEHHEDDSEPFAQRIVAVLEYRAADDAETVAVLLLADERLASFLVHCLFAALAEVVERARLERVSLAAASRAHGAIGPALLFQERLAGIVIRKPAQQFSQRHRFLIHDENNSKNIGRCQTPDNPR